MKYTKIYPMQFLFLNVYVAVLDRNQILFHFERITEFDALKYGTSAKGGAHTCHVNADTSAKHV